jgi:tetratricopeptide (TPR) repeat protein
MQSLRLIALIALVVAISMPAPARADGGGGGGGDPSPGTRAVAPKQADPQYTAAVRAIDASKFAEAIPLLEQVVARDQANADAYNWLAYATRRNGDPAKSIGIYQQALSLDPKHRGAHEYIGEAYLALNDLSNAKQHLATLDSLCFFPCSEYSDLKKAIQEFERNGGATKPSAGR